MNGNQSAEPHLVPGGVLRAMREDHELLARALSDFAELSRGAGAAAVGQAFCALETGLLAYLAMEDTRLLPGFGDRFPEEAEALHEEHARIRRRLEDLGIALELHSLRADMIDDFIDLLRAHAEREERLLYAWSEHVLSMSERHALFSWLLARLEGRMAQAR